MLNELYASKCTNGFHKPGLVSVQYRYSLKWAMVESVVLTCPGACPLFFVNRAPVFLLRTLLPSLHAVLMG